MGEVINTNLYARVKAVWRREQLFCVLRGSLFFLRWGIVMFLAGWLVDWLSSKWLAEIPAYGRGVILAALLGVSFRKAWQAGWRGIRRFDADRTALQIEERMGGMQSLLVSSLQFGSEEKRDGTSRELAELTCRKAEEAASGIHAADAVKLRALRRPGITVLGVAVLAGVLSISHGELMLAGLGRIFAPWLAISYPTRTQLAVQGGDMVVQEGKPVKISALVSGVVPRRARLAIRTGSGRPRIRRLDVVDGACGYGIDTAFRGFTYQISAGDARSAWYEVRVIAAPQIKRAAVTLEFPEYTQRKPETVDSLTFTVPETTKVSWKLELDVPVREGTVQLSGQEAVPMTLADDGLTAGFSQTASESRAYAFSWVDREQGYAFTSPSYYLQVAPDRAPRVELTAPARNVYATLGRKLELAFRGSDDHGIGESVVAYQVDKTEEARVLFTPSAAIDGNEQVIDWDYRNVLTNLLIGQRVTFAVELADRYPGEAGPHRVRSESRRIQFMSVEDYLAEVEKEKKRLLSQLRTIYREERKVHEVVLRLDPSDPVFIQTCQLEAVRQDLMRERIGKLAGSMLELTEDISANSISNETVSASLVVLREDLLRVSSNHIAGASASLRTLAGEKGGKSGRVVAAKAEAAHMVDSSARELGLLVLHLGYSDAAEVMARELHAAAETEASLRLRTIIPSEGRDELVVSQEQLGQWLKRLFEANPRNRESSIEEALTEFTLSRLVKQMLAAGIDTQLQAAAGLIRDGKMEEAARIQAKVIQVLLNAEFRLRVGAERESLAVAKALFETQARTLAVLRADTSAADEGTFAKMKARYADEQRSLHTKLQVLLMPHVPGLRPRLFDQVVPEPPPVADLLSSADAAMKSAADALARGDRAGAAKEQSAAETCFTRLAAITGERIAAMLQAVRIGRLAFVSSDTDEQIVRLYERQLSLVEKTEDAAADGTKSDYLADQQEGLAEAVAALQGELELNLKTAEVQAEHSPAIASRVADAARLMKETTPLLRENKPKEAVKLQEAAVTALTQAQELLAEHGVTLGAYAASLASAHAAAKPSPFVAEIVDEQRDMLEVTRKTKKEELPKLAIPQKNLVHAVNATLNALDPVAHLIGSGITMMFAKEDMAAAAEAMEIQDPVEALDAQEYIVETMEDLDVKLSAAIPRFYYIFEMTEALHESARECMLLREAQRRLREQVLAGAEPAAASVEQVRLRDGAGEQGRILGRIAGMGKLDGAVGTMGEAEKKLKSGDTAGAAEAMALAEDALRSEMVPVAELMTLLQQVLAPPIPGAKVSEEVMLLQDVLVMASQHKAVYRESCAVKPDQLKGFEARLREFEKSCDPFIEKAKTHKNPVPKEVKPKGKEPAVVEPAKPVPPANLHLKLVVAKEQLAKAASGAGGNDRAVVAGSQDAAAEALRHFIAEYVLKFVVLPGGGGDAPPAPSDEFTEGDDMFQMFMPGAVTGVRPPDGRLEWEVLGKRDRAALNENFARELPLEYRAILKDYYERLAK